MSMETQEDKAWKEDKLSKLQRLKAKRICELNRDLKFVSYVVTCIWSKDLIITLLQLYQLGENPMDLGWPKNHWKIL